MAKREIKNTRRGFVNLTTFTGKVVHAPGIYDTLPACRHRMYGVMYSDEPVNCPACLQNREDDTPDLVAPDRDDIGTGESE